jgi:hypothetical protein
MKKIYFLLVFVLLFGFVGLNRAKATCPDGWFEHWETFTYLYKIDGVVYRCEILVNFCCRWNPQTQKPEVILKFQGAAGEPYRDCWDQLRLDGTRWSIYLDTLYSRINEFAKNDPNCFPPCPPCDQPALFYEIKISGCVKLVSKPAIVTHDGRIIEWAYGLEYCDSDNYCLYTYACCSDWNTSPPETHIWLVSVQEYGTPACSTTEPQVPPPGKDWNEPWETECFAKPCRNQ